MEGININSIYVLENIEKISDENPNGLVAKVETSNPSPLRLQSQILEGKKIGENFSL